MLHSLLLVAATPSIIESDNYKYLNISYFWHFIHFRILCSRFILLNSKDTQYYSKFLEVSLSKYKRKSSREQKLHYTNPATSSIFYPHTTKSQARYFHRSRLAAWITLHLVQQQKLAK